MSIVSFLENNHIEYRENLSLAKKSTLRAGGRCSLAIFPSLTEEYIRLLSFFCESSIPFRVFGRLSNTCVCSESVDLPAVFTEKMNHAEERGNIYLADAGCSLIRLCTLAMKDGRMSFPGLYGIPGSIGGALYQNAGAFGDEISRIVENAECYDIDSGEVISLDNAECLFSYRDSIFRRRRLYPVRVRVRCERSLFGSDLALEYKKKRSRAQPVEHPSLGSTFRKVRDVSAGFYIERAGLKGYHVGGMEVSYTHAGFIINKCSGTARQYKACAEDVMRITKEKLGIELCPEVEFL